MTAGATLPAVYKMDEVVVRLRMGRRSFQKLIQRFPFYSLNGRKTNSLSNIRA